MKKRNDSKIVLVIAIMVAATLVSGNLVQMKAQSDSTKQADRAESDSITANDDLQSDVVSNFGTSTSGKASKSPDTFAEDFTTTTYRNSSATTVQGWGTGTIRLPNKTPVGVSYYDTPDYAFGVYVSGQYAYVGDQLSGLRIINVTNPASPTEVGYYDDRHNLCICEGNNIYTWSPVIKAVNPKICWDE